MLHLQTELSKRRDKRLELAARRRDYEVVNLTKRRRLDEEGVWSWRKGLAVFVGIVVNVFFGAMRVMN